MHLFLNFHTLKKNLMTMTVASLLVLTTACANSNEFEVIDQASNLENSDKTQNDQGTDTDTDMSGDIPAPPTPVGPPTLPSPNQGPISSYVLKPLSWESSSQPARRNWSKYLHEIILKNWSSLLEDADDVVDFCPRYRSLSREQKANVWAQIFAAITKFESGYSPTSRMHETTMGTDPITRRPVYSEGLLQLSYQDMQWAPWCEFDWTADKNLSATDPRKTILDPYKNLYCGVGIMAGQVKSKGAIVLTSGVYWAVIKKGGRYQKIAEIQKITRSHSLCK